MTALSPREEDRGEGSRGKENKRRSRIDHEKVARFKSGGVLARSRAADENGGGCLRGVFVPGCWRNLENLEYGGRSTVILEKIVSSFACFSFLCFLFFHEYNERAIKNSRLRERDLRWVEKIGMCSRGGSEDERVIMKFGNFTRSVIEVFERRIVSFNDYQFFPIPRRKIFNALFSLFFLFFLFIKYILHFSTSRYSKHVSLFPKILIISSSNVSAPFFQLPYITTINTYKLTFILPPSNQ